MSSLGNVDMSHISPEPGDHGHEIFSFVKPAVNVAGCKTVSEIIHPYTGKLFFWDVRICQDPALRKLSADPRPVYRSGRGSREKILIVFIKNCLICS